MITVGVFSMFPFTAFPPQRVDLFHFPDASFTAGEAPQAFLKVVISREVTLHPSTLLEVMWLGPDNSVVTWPWTMLGLSSTTATKYTGYLGFRHPLTLSVGGVYTIIVNMTIPYVVKDYQVNRTAVVLVHRKSSCPSMSCFVTCLSP